MSSILNLTHLKSESAVIHRISVHTFYTARHFSGRQQEMAAPEHTALLLKCYTKLKDFTTLEVVCRNTGDGWGDQQREKRWFFMVMMV